MQLFVLGMHRSGTSGVTRLLNMAGAYFGPEGIATEANDENPKGFWERRDVRALCDGLLVGAGADWWRVSSFTVDAIPPDVRDRHLGDLRKLLLDLDAHRPWVVKEPRLSLLFPLVRPFLEVPVCIHVAREPLEVAQSVRVRNGFPLHVGLALWELYTVRALAASNGLPEVLVHYDTLMADPVGTVTRLLTELREAGVDGLRVPAEREITAFLSPELHRQRRSPQLRDVWLNEQQRRLVTAIDGGRVFAERPDDVSTGAVEALRAFEDQWVELEELRARIAAADEQVVQFERRVRDEAARALRQAERLRAAESAIDAAEREAEALGNARTWRLAWGLATLRNPSLRHRGNGPVPRLLDRLDRSRAQVERVLQQVEVDQTPTSEAADDREGVRRPEPVPGGRRGRTKVAVLAWDVGHNPVGRAYVLAGLLRRRFDVEIWGAQFERYGTRVWAPLREAGVPIHAFPGRPFPDHLEVMEAAARRIDADALWVSKPRLPSYALGALAKELRNRPLVLDVDDHELAFFDESDGLDLAAVPSHRRDPELALPFGRIWTRACEPLIEDADALTVSNVALHEQYGGVIVPHARDETLFDPDRFDRAEIRRRLGVGDGDRLLLFGGTPRVHKGVIELLRALERLGDDRYRLLLFGTREFDELRPHIGGLERWAMPLPYQPFTDLPGLVGAADLACVLQDPDHPVSRYQMPAKVTDALAMAVPCLVRPVPPMRPLIDAGVLHPVDDETPLHERIAQVFADYDDALDRAALGRKLFVESYSYEAVSEVVAPVFERLLADPPPLSPGLRDLIGVQRDLFEIGARARARRTRRAVPARVPRRTPLPNSASSQYDIVMFWKQNDTGIYGRRQDMFLKYLERSGRVHSIVHFDNPTTVEGLVQLYRRGSGTTADQSRLVVGQTVSRLLHRRDRDGTRFYTFLHAGRLTGRLGLPDRELYPAYVEQVLASNGIGKRPVIFWVWPTNFDFPAIADTLDPDLVVADVVDDNRTWYRMGDPLYDRVEQNYQDVLARSDVVFANCEPVAASMRTFAPAIHVVPNGCELPGDLPHGPRPDELRGLEGPIIGYVGNLSSRLDIPLLEQLARSRRAWQFVFVGSAHLDRSILRLDAEPNVHFVGVKPYEEALRFVEHFDVALIPHVDNEMTRAMNPLKAYVYCAAGVPVVSTPVANLDELDGLITIADTPERFVAAIESALLAGPKEADLDVLRRHSWQVRVDEALRRIDDRVGAGAGAGATTP